jgi:hypothetical protein
MADPEPTIILQDLFHIRSRLKAAHMDILAVANRISILDAQFGNPPTHTLIVLAQRLMNRIDLYLVRPSDYPLYPNDVDDPVSSSSPSYPT